MIRAVAGFLLVALLVASCSDDEPAPAPIASASPSVSANAGVSDPDVVRWVTIGDFGKGDEFQQRVADRMCLHHEQEPFDWVVTTGDNVYPAGDPRDFEDHFEEPYTCLFEAGVKFHASLGNHDAVIAGGQPEIEDPLFGMPARYYTWNLGPVTFIMLDANTLLDASSVDEEQLAWLDEQLAASQSRPWTVAVFHHAVYSAGASHGSNPQLEALLADRFTSMGVDLVLNGHDHIFASSAVNGVTYLVTGGGGAPIDLCVVPIPEPVDRCFSYLHFTELEVTEDEIVATVITDSGRVLATIEVPPNQ